MAGNNQYTKSVLPETRFWKLVDKSNYCWLWKGTKSRKGYGRFVLSVNGHKQNFVAAHRYSYILEHGSIPNGLMICHKCNNPACVRPDHLYAGTNSDNMQDSIRSGTFPPRYGEHNGISKLSYKIVKEARERYKQGNIGFWRLAKEYGVSKPAMMNAIKGKTWKHVK